MKNIDSVNPQEYTITGIIDVGMYESILSPEFVLDNGEKQDDRSWKGFSFSKYSDKVRERAAIELTELFKQLPPELNIAVLSARIVSPEFYNYRTDTLYIEIEANSEMTEEEMQAYLDNYFHADKEAEFGAPYRIYEYISGNCVLSEFYLNEEDLNAELKRCPCVFESLHR